jgi:hypothetical protein
MVMDADHTRVKCFLDTCENTSEVDGPTGMALEPGWLSDGRGENRRYFCGQDDRTSYMRIVAAGGR